MHTIFLDAPVCMQVGPVIIAYQVSLSGRVRFVQQFVRKCIWYHFSARRCFLTGFDIQQVRDLLGARARKDCACRGVAEAGESTGDLGWCDGGTVTAVTDDERVVCAARHV